MRVEELGIGTEQGTGNTMELENKITSGYICIIMLATGSSSQMTNRFCREKNIQCLSICVNA